MKIVIAGAGAVGFHLAELLCRERQELTLIDTDSEVLAHADRHLDVLTILGDAASVDILEKADINNTRLFIAVTASEKTNLLCAILAKRLGAHRTITRVSNIEYLERENKERFRELGVDVLISPQQLAAQEIERLLQRASFTDLFEFENGAISVVGFTVEEDSPLVGQTIEQMAHRNEDFIFRAIALLRDQTTIVPDGDTRIEACDHLYLSTEDRSLEAATRFAGKSQKPIKKVMIIGGTPLALRTAQRIERDYKVSIVLEDSDRCELFVQQLESALVLQADPSNIDVLRSEALGQMDAFLALTPNSETNIVTCLLAKEEGVQKTIALVENVNYTHISQNIGIDTIINQKLVAANNIFRFVRQGKVKAVVSLHGVDAEIIEFELQKNNRLTANPIRDLHLPEQCIVAGVVRGEQSIVPTGKTQFQLGDKVIVLALPEAIPTVEKLFR